MKASVLDRDDPWRVAWILLAFIGSVIAHAVFVFTVAQIPIPTIAEPEWVEMVVEVQEPPPIIEELPPEPPKEVEIEKPQEPIDLEDIPPPPTDIPPPPVPPTKTVRRLTQGVSANSVVPGSGTGVDVRVGNTTASKAGEIDKNPGEFAIIPYTRVTKAPKLKNRPPLDVPQELIDAEIEGRVEVELTLSPEGVVTEVVLVSGLHSAADAACIANAKKTRWEPYLSDGTPAAVKGVPLSCRFEKIED